MSRLGGSGGKYTMKLASPRQEDWDRIPAMNTVIPRPVETEELPGTFQLTADTRILADEHNLGNAHYLRSLLSQSTGFPLPIHTSSLSGENSICLQTTPDLSIPNEEGYRLVVQPSVVILEAPSATGIFHAIQTLRQLLPVEVEEQHPVEGVEWQVPCLRIADWPRFQWRGFMLDEGRHFHGKETVKLLLELMALQKLNVFHWHLTEDQGWRIEIKRYPRLTEVGSRRAGTMQDFKGRHNGIPHQGYYTQDELRELVSYAGERHITIIPEIEIPGHSLAALAAYPELSCNGNSIEVATGPGIYPDIYCAGRESTFTFLENVLDEILDIFPAPYIHIGGDEAPKKRWKTCPDCQRRKQEQGLKDEHALQVYFTNRIAAYLNSKGRHIVGWNEILEPGLEPGAVVQYWLGNQKKLVQSIRNDKRKVVMSTYLDAYLDHSYSLMPLRRAYNFEPNLGSLADDENDPILGLEFPLWTEWVPDRARLDYQAFPRLTAMAETGWTPKQAKDYRDFRSRLDSFLARLDKFGIRYAPVKDVDPPKIKQVFGPFTIAQPQRKIAN